MAKHLFLLFSLLNLILPAQERADIYSLKIGTCICRPFFHVNSHNSPGLLSAVDESELHKGIRIHFPPRIDTVKTYHVATKKTDIKTSLIDHYDFEAGIDSMPKKDLDSLLKGKMVAFHHFETIRVVSYIANVVYADGQRTSVRCKAQTLSRNTELMELLNGKKEIIYIGIYNIYLKDKRKTVHIYEGYGWKLY